MAEKELHDDSTMAEDVDTFSDVAPMDSGLEAEVKYRAEGYDSSAKRYGINMASSS